MKLFKHSSQMTLTIVEVPRQSWRVLPPRKLEVALTLAGIVIAAIIWAVT